MGNVSFSERMAFLKHPMRGQAAEVARVAARVAHGDAYDDDLVDILVAMTEALSPRAFDQFVELTMAISEMTRDGADSAPRIFDAAMRAAQEVPNPEEERRGYLFALPVGIRGPAEPKHLKKSLTKVEQETIADLLCATEMVADGEVLILPRLFTVQQAAFMTSGQVNELKQLMSGRKFSRLYAAAVEVSQTWSAEETEHIKATEALEAATGLRTVVLVGMVYCDDLYDPPFPLARAFSLAQHDLPDVSHPDFEEEHQRMHVECDVWKEGLADMLEPILQGETTVLMEADGWFENMGVVCELQRSLLFSEIVDSILEEWELEDPSDLEVSMPDHAHGGLQFVMKSKRGDERKLTWRQLPDEPADRALFKFVHFMADNEIKLPSADLREMLVRQFHVDEGKAHDDERGRQVENPSDRGMLH